MQNEHSTIGARRPSLLKIVSYSVLALGVTLILCVCGILILQDHLIQQFIKPRITRAFTDAYPSYVLQIGTIKYSIINNRFEFDSVSLSAVDGTFTSSAGSFALRGINWTHLLWGGGLVPQDFTNSTLDAHDINLNLQKSHYKLHCKELRISVPDSVIMLHAVKYYPSGNDEQYFAESSFRSTRFHADVPRIIVRGVACIDLLEGKMYYARSLNLDGAVLDVMVNKDKPNLANPSSPLMPNEILHSIRENLQVDSLSIMNGRLLYSERFEVGKDPAWITFDDMHVIVKGIANHGSAGEAMAIHAQWKLANAGTMKLNMAIPISSPEFSFRYSGSLSSMNLSALNSFLEVSDQVRIKAGTLQEVAYEVNYHSGHANGNVRGVYTGLKIASIDKYTRSEKGISNGFISFMANTFKILRNNVPDKSGAMKIGGVKYARQRDDTFINVVWFSLRTGVRDVVGF
jgi:hypothetical protein